ncbi:MAG TPA: DUF6157 family protein [Edaphocola sp.]|nr:DUF6157 family protein [Edaphocola sp.]
MKTHATNYVNTFIEVAEDTKATRGTAPVSKGDKKTIAEREYELISRHPYRFTSDDVLFQVYADRNAIALADYKAERARFFSKGRPCFRASPLTKAYGFGLHANNKGKIALIGMETKAYQDFLKDDQVQKVKAMRNSRKNKLWR